MRASFIVCIGLLVGYWIDQTRYGGFYSRPLIDMLHHIANSF